MVNILERSNKREGPIRESITPLQFAVYAAGKQIREKRLEREKMENKQRTEKEGLRGSFDEERERERKRLFREKRTRNR